LPKEEAMIPRHFSRLSLCAAAIGALALAAVTSSPSRASS
jgi:peptide-methionine (S)-S-oxide reductase